MRTFIFLSASFFALTATNVMAQQRDVSPDNANGGATVFYYSKPNTPAAATQAMAPQAPSGAPAQGLAPNASGATPPGIAASSDKPKIDSDDEEEEQTDDDGKNDNKRQRSRGYWYAGAQMVASPRSSSDGAPGAALIAGFSQTGQSGQVSIVGGGKNAPDSIAIDVRSNGLRSGAWNKKKGEWAAALHGHMLYGSSGGYLANGALTAQYVFRVNKDCRLAPLGFGVGGTSSNIMGAGKNDNGVDTTSMGLAVSANGGCHKGNLSVDVGSFVILNMQKKDGDQNNATNFTGGGQANLKWALMDNVAVIATGIVDADFRSARDPNSAGTFTNYEVGLGVIGTFGHSNAPKAPEVKDDEKEARAAE